MTAPAAPMRVLVVGRGKVAHGIRHAARSRPTQAVCRLRTLTQVRATDLAWAELVLLTVPDGAIRAAAESLAPRVSARLPVLHLSGSRPVSEASACPEHGGLHPLASFASAQQPPSLSGVRFALGGTARALRMGRRLVRALGGKVLPDGSGAPLQGPAYHAAAALVANGGAALAASGVDILVRLGLDRASAQQSMAGLLRTVADNIERVGVPEALTGPIVRGDAATVLAHRAALRDLGGTGLATYDAIALAILATAVEAGLSPEAAAEVRRALRATTTRRVR
ncbi:MAG: DUF2520 domain-containing protein [Sandaracinaceae bacterium]|nr:DUF2520 domain-containing protein [Sandaracinaceae bacterium]